ADRLKGQGLNEVEAQAAARRAFGNLTQAQERFYEANRWRWWDELRQDVRYGLRQLRRNPGFTAIAVLTLALGIGANTAIFSIVNAVLLRPLPYSEPDRLVSVTESWPHEPSTLASLVPDPDWEHWRSQGQAFRTVAAYGELSGLNLAGDGVPARVDASAVTWDLFPMLGIRPALGRSFRPEEDRPAGPPVVILSHALWQQRFRSDPNVVGKTISLNEKGYTVIGVLPASFHFPADWSPELFLPLSLPPNLSWDSPSFGVVHVIGRLKSAVTLSRATSDLLTVNQRSDKALNSSLARARTEWRVEVVTLHERLLGDVRPLVLVLFGAVGFVLLLACANVANLQLAHAATREKEFAVRAAIGAGRWRLARQLLVESFALATLGGVVGLILGTGGVALFRYFKPPDFPGVDTIALDPWVFLFVGAITVFASVASGLAPLFVASRLDLEETLKESRPSITTKGAAQRLRGLLMVSEITLALILLTGAGLLIHSFVRLNSVDPGFAQQHLLTARVRLPLDKYPNPAQWAPFFRSVLDNAKGLPGIESVAVASDAPLTRATGEAEVKIEGQPTPHGKGGTTLTSIVSPSYFHALRIPILSGRDFTADDGGSSPRVAIVNEIFVRHFFGRESPLGHRIHIFTDWYSIIGVVGSTRHLPLTSEPSAEAFACYLQQPFWSMTIIARASPEASSLASALRGAVEKVDPNQPIYDVATMEQRFSSAIAPQRFDALVMAIFACLAVVLATTGVYGVMAYSVARRTHEIGIRMALGAEKRDVLGMVVGQGLKLSLIGVAIGIAGALALTRFLSSLLYGVTPTDPLTFAAVSLILIAVALLACYIPARRAAKVDPMVALRYE
ncbi:MAG TPA: ABC transporter permease, partial [Terriglobia bacterium]|nr:ABC transporter permease [Terriglobia bacterium]